MKIEINDGNFKKEILESEQPCLVDFWAPWCGPCQMIAGIIEEIAQEYQGRLKVCKLNVDEAQQRASEHGIMSIPTLMLFKNGKIADKVIGAVPKQAIESMIKPHL